MRVLVTGFEPFGGETSNPSLLAAHGMSRRVARYDVVSEVLPVAYGRSLHLLESMIRSVRPDCVLCLGLAGGREGLSVETLARNTKDARIPDNDGAQPRGEPIDPRSPEILSPRLPVGRVLRRMERLGIRAQASWSAGTYLCNYVFYGLARHIAREDPALLGGFIHVPWVHQDPGRVGMDLGQMIRGVEGVLEVLSL